MTVQIIDRHVKCPDCNHTFEVRQGKRGEGAQYVKKWTSIPSRIIAIRAHWKQLSKKPYTKAQIRAALQMRGLFISEAAWPGRLSEMLGLGMVRIISKEERSQYDHTTKAPMYVLKEHDV